MTKLNLFQLIEIKKKLRNHKKNVCNKSKIDYTLLILYNLYME